MNDHNISLILKILHICIQKSIFSNNIRIPLQVDKVLLKLQSQRLQSYFNEYLKYTNKIIIKSDVWSFF